MTERNAHPAPTRIVTRDELMKVEQECAGVLVRFFHYLDRRDYEKLAGLMTPQGTAGAPSSSDPRRC
jgi:hypothetical protein